MRRWFNRKGGGGAQPLSDEGGDEDARPVLNEPQEPVSAPKSNSIDLGLGLARLGASDDVSPDSKKKKNARKKRPPKQRGVKRQDSFTSQDSQADVVDDAFDDDQSTMSTNTGVLSFDPRKYAYADYDYDDDDQATVNTTDPDANAAVWRSKKASNFLQDIAETITGEDNSASFEGSSNNAFADFNWEEAASSEEEEEDDELQLDRNNSLDRKDPSTSRSSFAPASPQPPLEVSESEENDSENASASDDGGVSGGEDESESEEPENDLPVLDQPTATETTHLETGLDESDRCSPSEQDTSNDDQDLVDSVEKGSSSDPFRDQRRLHGGSSSDGDGAGSDYSDEPQDDSDRLGFDKPFDDQNVAVAGDSGESDGDDGDSVDEPHEYLEKGESTPADRTGRTFASRGTDIGPIEPSLELDESESTGGGINSDEPTDRSLEDSEREAWDRPTVMPIHPASRVDDSESTKNISQPLVDESDEESDQMSRSESVDDTNGSNDPQDDSDRHGVDWEDDDRPPVMMRAFDDGSNHQKTGDDSVTVEPKDIDQKQKDPRSSESVSSFGFARPQGNTVDTAYNTESGESDGEAGMKMANATTRGSLEDSFGDMIRTTDDTSVSSTGQRPFETGAAVNSAHDSDSTVGKSQGFDATDSDSGESDEDSRDGVMPGSAATGGSLADSLVDTPGATSDFQQEPEGDAGNAAHDSDSTVGKSQGFDATDSDSGESDDDSRHDVPRSAATRGSLEDSFGGTPGATDDIDTSESQQNLSGKESAAGSAHDSESTVGKSQGFDATDSDSDESDDDDGVLRGSAVTRGSLDPSFGDVPHGDDALDSQRPFGKVDAGSSAHDSESTVGKSQGFDESDGSLGSGSSASEETFGRTATSGVARESAGQAPGSDNSNSTFGESPGLDESGGSGPLQSGSPSVLAEVASEAPSKEPAAGGEESFLMSSVQRDTTDANSASPLDTRDFDAPPTVPTAPPQEDEKSWHGGIEDSSDESDASAGPFATSDFGAPQTVPPELSQEDEKSWHGGIEDSSDESDASASPFDTSDLAAPQAVSAPLVKEDGKSWNGGIEDSSDESDASTGPFDTSDMCTPQAVSASPVKEAEKVWNGGIEDSSDESDESSNPFDTNDFGASTMPSSPIEGDRKAIPLNTDSDGESHASEDLFDMKEHESHGTNDEVVTKPTAADKARVQSPDVSEEKGNARDDLDREKRLDESRGEGSDKIKTDEGVNESLATEPGFETYSGDDRGASSTPSYVEDTSDNSENSDDDEPDLDDEEFEGVHDFPADADFWDSGSGTGSGHVDEDSTEDGTESDLRSHIRSHTKDLPAIDEASCETRTTKGSMPEKPSVPSRLPEVSEVEEDLAPERQYATTVLHPTLKLADEGLERSEGGETSGSDEEPITTTSIDSPSGEDKVRLSQNTNLDLARKFLEDDSDNSEPSAKPAASKSEVTDLLRNESDNDGNQPSSPLHSRDSVDAISRERGKDDEGGEPTVPVVLDNSGVGSEARKLLSENEGAESDEDDEDDDDDLDSDDEDDLDPSKPYKLVVPDRPMLRLENVTAQTRSVIPDSKFQRTKKQVANPLASAKNILGGWFGGSMPGRSVHGATSADHEDEPVATESTEKPTRNKDGKKAKKGGTANSSERSTGESRKGKTKQRSNSADKTLSDEKKSEFGGSESPALKKKRSVSADETPLATDLLDHPSKSQLPKSKPHKSKPDTKPGSVTPTSTQPEVAASPMKEEPPDSKTEGAKSDSRKKKEKKKKKKAGLDKHLGKGKKARKVNSYGDELSVGTMDIGRLSTSSTNGQRNVVLTAAPNMFEDSEGLTKQSRPWEEALAAKKEEPGKHAKRMSTISMAVSSLGVFGSIDEDQSGHAKTSFPTSEIIHETSESSRHTDDSGANRRTGRENEFEDSIEDTSPFFPDEDEAEDSENVQSDEEKEEEDVLGEMHALSALEDKIAEDNANQNVNFDDMWDTVSCDASTAMDFEQRTRRKKRDKRKKRLEEERAKEEKAKEKTGRLRLFDKNIDGSSHSHKSKNKSHFSTEFLSAINRVFDDETVASFNDEEDDDILEMPVGGISREGSEKSIYVGGETSVSKGSRNSRKKIIVHNDGSDEDEDVFLEDGVEEEEEDEDDDDDDDDDEGSAAFSKSSRRSKTSRDTRSRKSHGFESRARTKASSRRTHRSHKTHSSRTSTRSRRPQGNAAEEFETEMKRLSSAKVLSIANLRQEMTDRRGTSVNLVKKEYATYRKKQNERLLSGDEDSFSGSGSTGKGSNSHHAEFERGDSERGKSEFNRGSSESDVFKTSSESQEQASGSTGLTGHFSRWNNNRNVSNLDDLATVQQDPAPATGLLGLANNMASNLPDMQLPNMGNLPSAPSLPSLSTPSLPSIPDMPFQANFTGMGLLSAIEEGSDDEHGLLHGKEDDYDLQSVKSHNSRVSVGRRVKLPKLKNPVKGLKKFVPTLSRGGNSGRQMQDMDLLGDSDGKGLLG